MSFLDRIRHAVDIVSAEPDERGSLRQQAEGLLGTELDEELVQALEAMASNVGITVFRAYLQKGVTPMAALSASRVAVLIAGMAVGKRLGAEEGEDFGRLTAQLREGS